MDWARIGNGTLFQSFRVQNNNKWTNVHYLGYCDASIQQKSIMVFLLNMRMYFSIGNNKKDGKMIKKATIKVETHFFEVLTLKTIFSVNFGQKQANFSHYVYFVCFVLFY